MSRLRTYSVKSIAIIIERIKEDIGIITHDVNIHVNNPIPRNTMNNPASHNAPMSRAFLVFLNSSTVELFIHVISSASVPFLSIHRLSSR